MPKIMKICLNLSSYGQNTVAPLFPDTAYKYSLQSIDKCCIITLPYKYNAISELSKLRTIQACIVCLLIWCRVEY